MIHALFITIVKFKPSSREGKNKKTIVLTRIDKKKYRTVGVKKSKNQSFSEKISQQKSSQSPYQKSLDLSDLKQKDTGKVDENIKIDAKKVVEKRKSVSIIKKQQAQIKKDFLKNLKVPDNAKNAFKMSNLNLVFEPPEGVKEDELNSFEKMLYGFQKRAFNSYLNAFQKALGKQLTKRPYLLNGIKLNKYHMIGKVDFDEKGNIVKIKMVKWSNDDYIQELFEETLKEIKSIPNPPNMIVNKDGKFTFYYQLVIGN